MPMSFHIDRRQRCIFIRLTGVLTEWDTGVTVQHMWHHADFDPAFDRLADALDVERLGMDRQFVLALAGDQKALQSSARIALVAQGSIIKAFQDVYAPNAGSVECRAFSSRQEALDWLGVEMPQFAVPG